MGVSCQPTSAEAAPRSNSSTTSTTTTTAMAMVKQSMNLGELENIRRSEQLSPMDVEKLRFLLPQEWRQKTKQLTQLEVILEAIDYIKTLQGKLDHHASS